KFSVRIENRKALVVAVRGDNPILGIDHHSVDKLHLSGAAALRAADNPYKFPILVELHDARVDVSIGDEDVAILAKRNRRRTIERFLRGVVSLHALFANREDNIVIRVKLVDHAVVGVHRPHTSLGIEENRVGFAEEALVAPGSEELAIGSEFAEIGS